MLSIHRKITIKEYAGEVVKTLITFISVLLKVPLRRIELPTLGLEGQRSIH